MDNTFKGYLPLQASQVLSQAVFFPRTLREEVSPAHSVSERVTVLPLPQRCKLFFTLRRIVPPALCSIIKSSAEAVTLLVKTPALKFLLLAWFRHGAGKLGIPDWPPPHWRILERGKKGARLLSV